MVVEDLSGKGLTDNTIAKTNASARALIHCTLSYFCLATSISHLPQGHHILESNSDESGSKMFAANRGREVTDSEEGTDGHSVLSNCVGVGGSVKTNFGKSTEKKKKKKWPSWSRKRLRESPTMILCEFPAIPKRAETDK